ncbi:MAG: DUF11 domain-containing protein [Oscillospiraceae bacterium]|nr:DUF11 domain-containing protein [Oscillospiraceae bacterium]
MYKKIRMSLLLMVMIVSMFWIKLDARATVLFQKPCLKITKTIDNNKPCPGTTINFIYQVTNVGNAALTNVSIQDNLVTQGSINPTSVTNLAPGQTAVFYGSLLVPVNAVVGSVVTSTTVARGSYCSGNLTTLPCSLTFIITGQVSINTTVIQIDYPQVPTYNYNTTYTIPDMTIPSLPSLPSTGENDEYWFFEKLFGL